MRDIPPEAICAVEHCGHPAVLHRAGSNCGHCEGCERGDGVFDWKAWHDFRPLRLAGGALTSEQERDAYQRAMRGEL